MKPTTQKRMFYILRFFRLRDKKVLYAYDTRRYANKRQWWYTDKLASSYHFQDRGDARGALRSVSFQNDLLKPTKSHYGTEAPEDAYFFEIVRVVETITKSYVGDIEVTDAPAMVCLGRSAE
jgi:hypothetical protein